MDSSLITKAAFGVGLGVGLSILAASAYAKQRVSRWDFESTVAFVTGGSSGIGLEVSKGLVRRGVKHLIVAARREEMLQSAVKELEWINSLVHPPSSFSQGGTRIHYVVMDVCSDESVRDAVVKAERLCQGEPISLLVCCAGFATPVRFLDSNMKDAEAIMQTNYFGCLRLMWKLMPGMVERGRGRIVLTSSLAALAPIAGYTLYAASKAGLRAFAHSVDMENSCFGVRVQVVSPPDVETPGLQNENNIKSPECRAISDMNGGKPFTAEAMAEKIIEGIEHYRFDITVGMDGVLLQRACAGMEPPTSVRVLLLETMCAGPLRLVMAFYSKLHYNIVYRIRSKERKDRKRR